MKFKTLKKIGNFLWTTYGVYMGENELRDSLMDGFIHSECFDYDFFFDDYNDCYILEN